MISQWLRIRYGLGGVITLSVGFSGSRPASLSALCNTISI